LGQAFAKGLEELNLIPETEDGGEKFKFIGIYSKNREEWIISDVGLVLSSGTSVCLYDTLGAEATQFIVEQTSLKTVVCSGDKVSILLGIKKAGNVKAMEAVVSFDEISAEDKALSE
jgi:long-chain acyl-CoA synthetase